jgi:Trk K+ transport system NAD-binding subunit
MHTVSRVAIAGGVTKFASADRQIVLGHQKDIDALHTQLGN